MKKIALYLALFFPLLISAQEKWSLDDCINYAKENSFDVQKQLFQNTVIKEDVTISKGNYLPDVNFFISQGYSFGNSFNISTGVGQQESRFNSLNLSSSFNLFNGYSNRYKLQKAKLNIEKGEKDLDQIRLDLILNITNKYLQVLFNKEILEVAKEQETISLNEVNRLKQLFNNAFKSESDLLEMNSTYTTDQNETLIAQNNIANSLIELQELLDIKSINNFDILEIDVKSFENNYLLIEPNDVFDQALEINPALKSTLLTKKILEKDIKIGKADYYPKLDLNYSYSSSYYTIRGSDDIIFDQFTNEFIDNGFLVQLDNNRTHNLSFNLTIPIFNQFRTSSNIKKSKIELELNEVEYKNQIKELKNKIDIAFNNHQTAKATLNAAIAVLDYQKKAFTIAKSKFKKGYITSYEFLESKSKYIQSESDLIKAKYDHIFKLKVLNYYQSKN